MERFFCFGKKDFCDSELCSLDCEFCDDSGGIEGNHLEIIFESIFGKEYDLSRIRDLVKADRKGKCAILPDNYDGTLFMIWKGKILSSGNFAWTLNELGKTVFLTREAAEEAMKEKRYV